MTPFSALVSRGWCLFFALAAPTLLPAQVTTINVNNTVLQKSVKRFGINLGVQNFYDSGQIMKNLLFINPSFEGQIFQSTVRCGSGTQSSCTDENLYSGWPGGFWDGATFEGIYGSAAGRTGTVTTYIAGSGATGAVFTFSDTGLAPSNGDYLVVRRSIPGDAVAGWWPSTSGGGAAGTNTTDLPPGTTGKQTAVLSAPTAADSAKLSSYFDVAAGRTFLQLNGQYRLSFKAKGLAGSKSIAVSVARGSAGLSYLNQTVSLTNAWAPYSLTFSASETGTAIGGVETSFATAGGDSFLLDDVSLEQIGTDPGNATVFRDEVVQSLKKLKPGVMRFWFNQLGESLDNMIANPSGRQRSGYSPFFGDVNFVSYGLTDFLELCEAVGAEPWVVMPMTLSTSEASNLIDYLAGGVDTPYGAKRAAAGHAATWTSSFARIHLEFGNEAWNGIFKGGNLEYPDAYGSRSQTIFGAMRANANYGAASFDLIVNGQSAYLGRNQAIQSYVNNNDSFSIAPYMMYNLDSFSTIEDLFGSTFAEAEAFVSGSGTAEGIAGGYILQNQKAVQAAGRMVPIVTSEMNLSPKEGAVTQDVLDGYGTSVGGAIAVADSMFQQLRAGVLTQNLYQLTGAGFVRGDGKTINLWGAVVDLGASYRERTQFLATEMANSAIGDSPTMFQTKHTGADPTWKQPMRNYVQFDNAHYLQSFAFGDGVRNSLVVFNLHRTGSLPVSFAGANAPTGTVQIQQLTSANITDTNESSKLVAPTSSTVSGFDPAATLSLPPYSMTVLSWGGKSAAAPIISGVTATAITSTSATITWMTDQPSTSDVSYGTTPAYGSASVPDSALVTSHSVTITGLTPGTLYDYAVASANSAAVSAASGNFTFTTAADVVPAGPPPVLGALAFWGITGSGVTVSWATEELADTAIEYGLSAATLDQTSPVQPALTHSHGVVLTGLSGNTTYYFRGRSTNGSGAIGYSVVYTFKTLDLVGPVVSNIVATPASGNAATVSWSVSEPSTSQIEYGPTTGYGWWTPRTTSLTTPLGWVPSGLIHLRIHSFDAAGNETVSADYTFIEP